MSYDPTTAKEMLLMAPSVEEQQFWVARLLKKIQKSGYKATGQVYLTPLFNSELFFCSLDNKIKKP